MECFYGVDSLVRAWECVKQVEGFRPLLGSVYHFFAFYRTWHATCQIG